MDSLHVDNVFSEAESGLSSVLRTNVTIPLFHAFQKAYQNAVSQNDFISGKNVDTFNSIKKLETLELYMLLIN